MPKRQQCKALVEAIYIQFDASHDFEHVLRVEQNALAIAASYEDVDIETLQLAVYLHDVSDKKYAADTAALEQILKTIQLPVMQEQHVRHIIEAISFRGGNEIEAQTLEAQIARDADRLDALGAIGIARAFAFGGAKGRKLYDDAEAARTEMTEDAYYGKPTATVTHFYEKLLTLQQHMCTEKGRALAKERHAFMKQFLTQLAKEREGLL